MCSIYDLLRIASDKDAPLTHKLMRDLPGFEQVSRSVNGVLYKQAYAITLLDDILVTVVDLDEHYPGTGAFYVSTDKNLQDVDGSVRTVAELCAKLKEIMLAYSEDLQKIQRLHP